MTKGKDVHYGMRGFGFIANGKFYMQRCGVCDKENYILAVSSGQCAWCGDKPDVKELENKT